MKCVYVKFSPSKQQSFFRKVSLNSCLIGLEQLYTGRAGGSSRKKAFVVGYKMLSQCVSRGIVVVNACGKSRIRFRAELVSLLLFFFFSFTFSYCYFCFVSLYSLRFLN